MSGNQPITYHNNYKVYPFDIYYYHYCYNYSVPTIHNLFYGFHRQLCVLLGGSNYIYNVSFDLFIDTF